MNETLIVQLITGAIGSVGFGILFHMKRKYLPLAAAGALISWMVFILGKAFWGNIFLPTLFASFVTDVYAEILARICKETSTSFFVTSIIPLIPGSTLYYCMNSILEGNTVRALEYGRDTFLFAFGIAAGMSIAWSICYFLRSIKEKQKVRNKIMQTYTYVSKGKFELMEKPKPVLMHERDAIVKVTLASICSSDLHIKHGSVPRAVPGITVGHEMVGVVEEVGSAVTNLTFKTGGVDGCDCKETLRLIEEGKIDTEPLITHTYPLSKIAEAYDLFENKKDGVIKVAVEC